MYKIQYEIIKLKLKDNMDNYLDTINEKIKNIVLLDNDAFSYFANDKMFCKEEYREISRIKKDVFEKGGSNMSTWFQELMEKKKEEGIQEGMQKGILEGKQKGLLEGKQEGLLEGKQDILDKLLNQGIITKEMIKQLNLL